MVKIAEIFDESDSEENSCSLCDNQESQQDQEQDQEEREVGTDDSAFGDLPPLILEVPQENYGKICSPFLF